ncbi:hypothetical protein U1Q18_008690 [Sarracenia purpurea var. burkii]
MKNTIADQVDPSTTPLGHELQIAVPPPLPNHRQRPRVREVSSRFMSSPLLPKHAVSSSIPISPPPEEVSQKSWQQQQQKQQHRSKSVQRSQQRQESEPLCTRAAVDDNVLLLPDSSRRMGTPLPLGFYLDNKAVNSSAHRKNRVAVKRLLKENGGGRVVLEHSDVFQPRSLVNTGCKFLAGRGGGHVTPSSSRPDTPTVTAGLDDRMTTTTSSRFRLGINQNLVRPTNGVTAAAKLLQSSGLSLSAQPPNPEVTNVVNGGDASQETASGNARRGNDDKISTFTASDSSTTATTSTVRTTTPPTSVQTSKATTRSIPDLRSSLPEVDVLPTLSTRLLLATSCTVGNAIGCNSSKFYASPCSRSLNLPLSNSGRIGGGSLCLPPFPCSKLGPDSRRGRKDFSRQEHVHSLKLLHNHYLQWRYANAKAEASAHAQRREAESALYSLEVMISDLHDAVKRKRIELGRLKQTKTICAILEAHMSYLDEWSTLEEEYLSSLSEAIQALVNASLQLPVGGNVQVDMFVYYHFLFELPFPLHIFIFSPATNQ